MHRRTRLGPEREAAIGRNLTRMMTPRDHGVRDEIIESAARAFYVSRWADDQEERDWPAGSPSGRDLDEMAPRTPKKVVAFAKKFIAAFERTNSMSVDQLYERAAELTRQPGGMRYARRPPSADLFGHYLAMQAMGSGVAWSDDYPSPGFALPEAQWYGGSGEVSTRRGSEV